MRDMTHGKFIDDENDYCWDLFGKWWRYDIERVTRTEYGHLIIEHCNGCRRVTISQKEFENQKHRLPKDKLKLFDV
jgi:hypothetical protein